MNRFFCQENSLSQRHRAYFNRLAAEWRNHPPSTQFLKILQSFGIQPNDIVLDIGCGAGCASQHVIRMAPKARVLAIDLSEKMLAAARKNLAPGAASFVCNDACFLGVKSLSVQKIICYSTFPHIKNQQAALQEFYRVLTPSGKILIFHNCCSRRLNIFHAQIRDIVAFDKLPKAEQLAVMVRQCGFDKVDVLEKPDLYYIEAQKGA